MSETNLNTQFVWCVLGVLPAFFLTMIVLALMKGYPLSNLIAVVLILEVSLFSYIFCYMDTSKKMVLKRMRGYSELKKINTSCERKTPKQTSDWTGSDFEVLLGTLKKIETKNAALLIIWVFVGQAIISQNIFEPTLKFQLSFLIVVTLLPVLFLSIIGMKQVDQMDFDKYSTIESDQIPCKLKSDLIDDLIRKEKAFRFSYFMSLSVIGAAMLLMIIFTIHPELLKGLTQITK